jgi:CRP-like cAMP-binding protein
MTGLIEKLRNKYPGLPEDKFMSLLGLTEVLILEEGEIFIRAGEKVDKLGLVLEGMMRNYIINDNGDEVTVIFAAEMQVIAPYKTIFLGLPASETTAAVEKTILLAIDFKELKKMAFADPAIMPMYVEMVESRLVATIQRIEDFTQKKPEQRYQRILDTQAFLIDRVPLKYLASYLGITPVSLSRIRKRLSQNRT